MGSIWDRATPVCRVPEKGSGKRGKKNQEPCEKYGSSIKEHFPDEKIEEIAAGMITGKYFTSDFIDPAQYKSMLHLIFMPLAFATKDMVDFMKKNDVTMIYAEMKDALPRSINRHPCFIDAHLVPREIHKKILDLYHEKEKILFPNGRPKN